MPKRPTNLNSNKSEKSKGLVVLPYVKNVTDTIQRMLKKHNIASAVRPHTTMRKILVHPKDQIKKEHKCGVIYEVPCKNCNQTYVGETGRQLGVRLNEHRKETEIESGGRYTRSQRRASEKEWKKSAITEHACRKNHVIDWDNTRVIDRESDRFKRWVRESIWIAIFLFYWRRFI